MITTLLEISTTKIWMMHPPVFNAMREMLQNNISGRIALTAEQTSKRANVFVGTTAAGEKINMAMPGSRVTHSDNDPEVQQFVAILPVCGPITRNGDACSYGSVDLRDAMIEASNQEECAGIILYINSYGGSAAAIADYKYAINHVHQQGLKVIAFIDGACCSAAQYLAVLCDSVYFLNEKDTFGSIGVMAGFWTLADGEKNPYTNETWHEIYAKQSYDKNKWHREAAEGNYEEVEKDLDKTAEEFMADVKAHRPNVTDEHLHGATFEAKDIVGILADGQSTLDECIDMLVNDFVQNSPANTIETNKTNSINMSNYPLINAACGMKEGEIKVTEEGAFMNAPLLDDIEFCLNDSKQQVADAQQKAATAEQSFAELQGKFEELKTQLSAANDAIAKKNDEIASLTSAKATAEEELKGAKEALAGAEQRLADKDAQIAELTNEPAEEQAHGEAPANNGEGAKFQTLREFDPSGYKTNAERKAAFERFKRGE